MELSHRQNNRRVYVDERGISSEDRSLEADLGWGREFRVLRSAVESREFYEADGSLLPRSKTGQLELRAVLDEPSCYQMIYSYAKQKKKKIIVSCWYDIQNLKIIDNKYVRRKGLELYTKYIKRVPDDLYNLLGLKENDKDKNECVLFFEDENTQEINNRNVIIKLFLWLQLKCFNVMYDQLYMQFKITSEYKQMSNMLKIKYNQVLSNDFDYISYLGTGAFGIVVKCRKISTGIYYAMKIQRKRAIIDCFEKEPWRTDDEKKAYACCSHPYLVEFAYSFQTPSLAIVAMELITHGDLQALLLNAPNNQLDHEHIQFYFAELISVISYLHDMGLIYRDLKPGNILLHGDGHIRLADLGTVVDVTGDTIGQFDEADTCVPIFRKFGQHTIRRENPACIIGSKNYCQTDIHNRRPRAKSIVGTIGYMAPEVLIQFFQPFTDHKGYTECVDWWSLGATIYKLYTGSRPYIANMKDTRNLEIPKEDQAPQQGLLSRLLNRKSGPMSFTASVAIQSKEHNGIFIPPKSCDETYIISPLFIDMENNINTETIDLITKLLDFNEVTRIGSSICASLEIKLHPYFNNIDWKLIEEKKLTPPPIPKYCIKKIENDREKEKEKEKEREREKEKLKDKDNIKTSVESSVTMKYHSLEELITSLNCGSWLDEIINPDENEFFNSWDYVSVPAINKEIEIADKAKVYREMNL